MSSKYSFEYTESAADIASYTVDVKTDSETLEDVVDAFVAFLRACGFAESKIQEYITNTL